jgi:hypothetical protein
LDVSADYLSAAPLRHEAAAACETLTWTEAFSNVERLIGHPRQTLTVSFAGSVMQIAAACEGRQITLDRFRLQAAPAGSRWTRWLRLSGSSSLVATRFVPGLLTFLDKPSRIALVSSDMAAAAALRSELARHAPWHRFERLRALPQADGDFDFFIVYAEHVQDPGTGAGLVPPHAAALVILAPMLFEKLRPVPRLGTGVEHAAVCVDTAH